MTNPKGKPQEWDRDGISPADHGGSKASRGCETLGAQPNRQDWESAGCKWLSVIGKTLKGKEPQEE